MSQWEIIGLEPDFSVAPPATPPPVSARQAEDQSLAAMQAGAAALVRPGAAPLGGRRPLPRVPSSVGRMVRNIPARLRRDQELAQAPRADARIPRPPGPPPGLPRTPVQRLPKRKDLPFNTRVYNWYAPTVKAINDGITYYAGPHLSQALANLTNMLQFTDLGDAETSTKEAQKLMKTLRKWKPGKSGGAAVANQLPLTAAAMVGMVAPGVPAKGAVQLGKLGKPVRKLPKRAAKARRGAARPGPDTALVYTHGEGVPGAGIDHLPKLLKAPHKDRAAITSRVSKAFQDPQGRDIINKNIGLNAITTRPTQGAYRASPQHPVEYNPSYAAGVKAPLVGGAKPRLRAADEQRLHAGATLRAAMTGQHATPYSGLVSREGGTDAIVPRDKKLSRKEIKAFVDRYGLENVAVADTGRGVNVLNSGKPYTERHREKIGNLLGGTGEAYAARNVTNPAKNYPDLQAEWLRAPGSRRVTQRVVDELGKLSGTDFKRLDGPEIRSSAGDIHKIYTRQAKAGEPVRKDLMNYLSIVRDKGLAGLRAALDAKEFLPAITAIGLAPQLYRMSRGAEDE